MMLLVLLCVGEEFLALRERFWFLGTNIHPWTVWLFRAKNSFQPYFFCLQTLIAIKFSRIVGMDDLFIGRFIFIWNLLFLAIIHSTRYWLGSMHESLEFQLLSGIKVSYQNVFWPIFIKTLFVIAGISVAGISCKLIYTPNKTLRN